MSFDSYKKFLFGNIYFEETLTCLVIVASLYISASGLPNSVVIFYTKDNQKNARFRCFFNTMQDEES